MGLLSAQSIPLRWKDAKKYSDRVRTLGLNQFLEIYHKQKDLQKQPFVWGDEIEYIIVNIDKEKQKTKLSLRANEILPSLQKSESDYSNGLSNQIPEALWRPEGGSFMIEGTPGTPYGNTLKDLLKVESNMKNRRNLLKKACHVGDIPVTLVHYPRFGCPNELIPHYDPIGQSTQSIFLPDEVFYPHVRFLTLPENTRCRRGSKVEINVPIYHDKNTPKPFIDPTIPWDRDLFIHDKETKEAAKPDHIYMDATGFGVGCCCLQVTFQACDINEARYLYDQLAPVAPIMLALTSATPIFRGYLADTDARWNIIAGSADDRTKEERGLEPLKNDRFIIPKSRYDSISTYISNDKLYKPKYNDLDLVYDKNIYQTLLDNDVDDLLAKHVSHLFIRDPLIIFEELLGQDYHNSSEHFENLQTTNWQTVRFKPPPPNTDIGWRVEFRSMEIQLTDFENAAFSVFMILLSRTIQHYGLNFYMPISKVDENMQTAQKRGSVLNDQFYFRKNVFNSLNSEDGKHEDDYELMTMNDIINGKENGFPGFIPMIQDYLKTNMGDSDDATQQRLLHYLCFISKRASGELMTAATYLRKLVQEHPDYKQDSVVSSSITYDIVKAADEINQGKMKAPELLGDFDP